MKDTGGAAFPSVGEGFGNPNYSAEGMTLRDYFAAKAMQGLLSMDSFNPAASHQEVAEKSYRVADALLEARNQE